MTTDLSKYDVNQLPSADVLGRQRYAIVVADWNSEITYLMAQGALDTFIKHGVAEDNIAIVHVPGAVELTYGAARIMKEERVDAVIVIGCVIQGDTPHFDYVCAEAAKGVTQASLKTGVPVAFGILTTENIQQAVERAGTKAGNKGYDAAMSAIEMANLYKKL